MQGDFDITSYSTLEWMFFILACILMPILLFNMLIAIMRDTFDRVQGIIHMIDYKEKCELITELESLDVFKDKVEKEDFLLVCRYQQIEVGQTWQANVKTILKILAKA